jgi:hypothetical protein
MPEKLLSDFEPWHLPHFAQALSETGDYPDAPAAPIKPPAYQPETVNCWALLAMLLMGMSSCLVLWLFFTLWPIVRSMFA